MRMWERVWGDVGELRKRKRLMIYQLYTILTNVHYWRDVTCFCCAVRACPRLRPWLVCCLRCCCCACWRCRMHTRPPHPLTPRSPESSFWCSRTGMCKRVHVCADVVSLAFSGLLGVIHRRACMGIACNGCVVWRCMCVPRSLNSLQLTSLQQNRKHSIA